MQINSRTCRAILLVKQSWYCMDLFKEQDEVPPSSRELSDSDSIQNSLSGGTQEHSDCVPGSSWNSRPTGPAVLRSTHLGRVGRVPFRNGTKVVGRLFERRWYESCGRCFMVSDRLLAARLGGTEGGCSFVHVTRGSSVPGETRL